MDSENRLWLPLVGLTELRRRLAMAVHESLAQRLVVRHHLNALDRDELDAYLSHRLRLAGCQTPCSSPPPSRRCRSARGMPRRINRIAHYALTAAALSNARTVTAEHHELSDEAAAHLSELFNDLAVVFDGDHVAFRIPCRPHEHRSPPRPFATTGAGPDPSSPRPP